jgi:hypothetical protein
MAALGPVMVREAASWEKHSIDPLCGSVTVIMAFR